MKTKWKEQTSWRKVSQQISNVKNTHKSRTLEINAQKTIKEEKKKEMNKFPKNIGMETEIKSTYF